MLSPEAIETAGQLLREARESGRRLASLPDACRPQTRADGYAVQAAVQANTKSKCFIGL